MQEVSESRRTEARGAPPAVPTHQYLRIALGQSTYAVAIDSVREILKVVHMTELPLMPDFVRGVMNLRGAVVPVIDLSARLGLGLTPTDRRTCIVIVDVDSGAAGTQTLGMLVDAVHEVVDFTPSDIEAVPNLGTPVAAAFLTGMARVRGQIVPLLDTQRVLLLDELSSLIAEHTNH
jgi:purine-binding chemotaxis protein CheW